MAEGTPIEIWAILIDTKHNILGGLFLLRMSATKFVYDMKGEIKDKKSNDLADVDADNLRLWKPKKPLMRRPTRSNKSDEQDVHAFLETCQFPPVDSPEAVEDAIEVDGPVRLLEEAEKILNLFQSDPHDRVQVIAQRPASTLLSPSKDEPRTKKRKLDDIMQKVKELPAPSKAAAFDNFLHYLPHESGSVPASKLEFLCNRPFQQKTMPLSLLHPAFGRFRADFWNRTSNAAQPNSDDLKHSRALAQKMSSYFSNEEDRRKAFKDWFFQHTGYQLETVIGQPTSRSVSDSKLNIPGPTSDGHLVVPGLGIVCFISEGKNELVNINSETRIQLLACYLNLFEASHEAKKYLDRSCLPAILVAYEGSHIEVHGVIMHPDGTVQSEALTPALILNCDWRDHDQNMMIARFVMALRLCLQSLIEYYNCLKWNPEKSAADSIDKKRRTPYPHQYSEAPEDIQFSYVRALNDRLVFEVEEQRDDKRKVVVKFTETYSIGAHKLLAYCKLAPRLLGYDELAGGWLMITMEYLSDDWIMLEDLSKEKQQDFKGKIAYALNLLHKANYVHGDVRACNIFVRGSVGENNIEVKLLDFDVSGHLGKTKYPPYWNSVTVVRPADAVEGAPLKKEHDKWMLSQIFDSDASHVSGFGKMVKVA